MDKLTIKNLDLYYSEFKALKNINLNIQEKEITAFIGPSGCGKSTLLKSLNRMNDLVEGCRIEGEVLLDGENIYKDMDVNLLRKRVGMVFQKPNPFPMSIYDNIAYGPRTHGIRSKVKLDELVENSLRGAAIWDEVKDRLKKSALGLSGGQQQRICIARALAVQPEVLLMDEPTSCAGPHFHSESRGTGSGAEKRLHHRHGNSQHAAGSQNLRPDRIFPAGRDCGVRKNRADFLHAERQEDRGLYYREVWMMKTKFDEQLEEMHVELIKMGSLCEQAITLSSRALLGDEKSQVEQVYSVDGEIDQQEREIENICMRLLLLQRPFASDLRKISAALKMISDMERIGDQASDIADMVPYIRFSEAKSKVHIEAMAKATVKMVTDSVDAFVQDDLDLAQRVIDSDDEVDDLFNRVKNELIDLIYAKDIDAKVALDLLMTAKYYERIGDHAVNIAEWVVYSITGVHKSNE